MRRVVINNFGAIKRIDICLDKKLQVIIGEQASGKSTLAKIIYFSLKVRDYLLDYLITSENFKQIHPNEQYLAFLKYVRKQFMGCFGTTKHMNSFSIIFDYDVEQQGKQEKRLKITLDQKYAKIVFSSFLMERIGMLIREAAEIFEQQDRIHPLSVYDNVFNDLRTRDLIRQKFSQGVNDLFKEDEEIVYIPAGRSILSTMSEQLKEIDTTDITQLDLPLKEFIALIQKTKPFFGSRIPDIVKDYTKTVTGQIRNNDVNLAYSIIKKILKADYVNERDGEKLYYSGNKWVKLMYASSGQQESLWILLLFFLRILRNQRVFMVLEEPEAHLFPSAQKNMIEMIALLIFSTNSGVFVTTHSPYILTSINLLTYSGKVENLIKAGTDIVVPKQFRISPQQLAAYKISNDGIFSFSSLIDSKEMLINAEAIDTISEELNNDTDRIMDMEVSMNDL